MPELIQARQKKLGTWVPQEEKENYMFCANCRRYSLISKCKKEDVTEIRTVTTFTDCAYGDDDRVGDAEYNVSSLWA